MRKLLVLGNGTWLPLTGVTPLELRMSILRCKSLRLQRPARYLNCLKLCRLVPVGGAGYLLVWLSCCSGLSVSEDFF